MRAVVWGRAVGLVALLLCAPGTVDATCPGTAPTSLSLTLIPGEIRGLDHVLQVNVQADGCLRVRRPAHWRDAGTWTGSVAAPVLREAAIWSVLDGLARFDGERVRAELEALEASRAEAFAVAGADRYVLRWTDSDGQSREASFEAVFQYAERYPDRSDLAAFAAVVSMLQDEATRSDLIAQEPQP